MHSPLEQFQLKNLLAINFGGLDASFTNSALFMMIAVAAISLFLIGGMSKAAMIPGRWQSAAELSYEFIANLLRDNAGEEGKKYFPLVFSIFMFVLFGNAIGMIPYTFTFTSHIAVTFAMAAAVFIFVTVLGFVLHGFHFFSLFVPHGAPKALLPLVIPIELISYMSRPLSLSVRLFANMLVGHMMMKVFAGFAVMLIGALGAAGYLAAIVPLSVVVALTGFELLVAALQAYVFTILTCIYLHDAIHLH